MSIHSPSTGTYSGITDSARPAATTSSSGVAWGAVLAGALAASVLSFLLLILGMGLGLSAVSPWSFNGSAMGLSTILWIAFTQLAAAGIGGYMAGRLRVRWNNVDDDEVYFRDTAHGFLAWSVSTLLMTAVMAGAIRAVLGGAVDIGSSAAGAATAAASGAVAATAPSAIGAGGPSGADDYFTDLLLRAAPQASGSAASAAPADPSATRAEIGKILANSLATGSLPAADRPYLASLVVQRTGLSQPEAERRVDEVYGRLSKAKADAAQAARETADKARKVAATSALWIFVTLLLGAFLASWFATVGGRLRDKPQ